MYILPFFTTIRAPLVISMSKIFLLAWGGKLYLVLIFRLLLLLFATVGRFSLFFGFLMTFHFSARDRVRERDRERER